MNKVILTGRFVKDADVRYTQGNNSMAVAKFSLAVDRRFAKKDKDQQTADFINCTAFRNTAEFIEKYFRKGMKAVVFGRIQTGSYKNKDGNTVHTTDVVVEEIEFGESKQQNSNVATQTDPGSSPYGPADSDGFMNIPDNLDDDSLPFN
jgi:single-strand DNA-binding protein